MERAKKELKTTLSAYGMGGTDLMFEQERSLKMCLPTLYRDLEKEFGLPIPMMTTASSFPFIFQTLQDDGDAMILLVVFCFLTYGKELVKEIIQMQ